MNRLLAKLYGKRIAIVGSGPVSKDYSDEIDAADIVVRFNHFYRYDYGLTGKRVDIVIQTFSPVWFNTTHKHDDIIRTYNAEVFMIKHPERYTPEVHKYYKNDIKVNNVCRYFEKYAKFTTGGCFLVWLSQNLFNANVKVYGFEPGEAWTSYIDTYAKQHKDHADEERLAVDTAIDKLQRLKITDNSEITINKHIVIPVKGYSEEAPGKNILLLPRCINECKNTKLPITVITDDKQLADIAIMNGVSAHLLPTIEPLEDVTISLRKWRDETNYFGDIAVVQCTSLDLNYKWIAQCFDRLNVAPIVATAVKADFKINSLFIPSEGDIWMPALPEFGYQSVPRQKLPQAIRVTGAVEAIHSDNLDLDSLWMGGRVEMVEIK